jgi:two-component system response regulator RegA
MDKSLLIVEDDEVFAATLMRRLSQKGFDCHVAHNGSDALLACRQYLPKFILLDMKLAQESGLNLIKPMRSVLPSSRLLLLTGFASIATAVDAIKLGADDYLAKPVDTQTLLAALNNTKVVESEHAEIDDVQTLSAEQAEWEHIQQVLKMNNGNISATARQLSMHRRTLQRKLQKRPVG